MAKQSEPYLILASRSVRRRALLEEAGYEFKIVAADDQAESAVCVSGKTPRELVQRLALAKAENVANKLPENDGRWIIIAADTVADLDGQVLGKPVHRADAKRMLTLLNGREHDVHTGVCLQTHSTKILVDVATTRLRMDDLRPAEIETYLATQKWQGKAGGFGYQDGWDWLQVIDGEESNVVGLPLNLLKKLLAEIQSQPD